jgi:hypothetical protein
VDVLASPFRFNSNGNAARVTQGSDAHKAQNLASLVRTWPGELPLAPTYGVGNSPFDKISPSEIAVQISTFYPEIAVDDIVLYWTKSGKRAVEITFRPENRTGDQ